MTQDPVFDMDEALARVDHDRETFDMMLDLFVEHGPKDLAEAKAALDVQNSVGVARSSHRLKGAVLQFCAPAALDACKALEDTAKAGNLAQAEALYATLERELLRLLNALRLERDKGLAA
jgi:HPt (histidine-containing phosphotransfer) domain-containing protein